ncbi:MAG TPA: NADH-quinone oxidoreductase subunit NuoI [Limnochordia bacterium]
MIKGIAKGLGTTLRVLFRPKVTIEYPNKKKARSTRFRGRHELRLYDNGLEMCVGCELCQVACPANAITVYAAENDPRSPHSPGERYAYRYEVDMLRCIFCGLCEEACPTEALHLTQEFELAAETRGELVYKRDRLVAQTPSQFRIPPGVYPHFTGHGYGGPDGQDSADVYQPARAGERS